MEDTQIRQEIVLELRREGFSVASKEVDVLSLKVKKLCDADDSLKGSSEGVRKAIFKVVKEYKVFSKELDTHVSKVKKAIKSVGILEEAYMGVGSALGEVKSGFKSLIFPTSLGAAIRQTDDYNKRLLTMSSRVSRLGIGTEKLEKTLTSLSSSLALTKQEVHGLFTQFERKSKFNRAIQS